MTETKTLAQMTAEVVLVNEANGWYENCATFPEAMALLHSEVSEALDAWRRWGLKDATKTPWSFNDQPQDVHPPKPEGVGSEFADVFIRLLDDAWLFGQVDLEQENLAGAFSLSSFPANMNTLHDLISLVSAAGGIGEPIGERFAAVLVFLRQCCEEYGVDLMAEYERKLAYNKVRGYRHGGKKI